MKGYQLSVLLILFTRLSQANEVEFMHWWTSRGEIRAVSELTMTLEAHGLPVLEMPIPGGGGDSARTILQARTLAGNPPHMAILQGPAISSWAALGILQPLHQTHVLPPLVDEIHRFDGKMVALPIALHRLNWLWLNRPIFKQSGHSPPTDWATLTMTLEDFKAKGLPGLAIGNDPWQTAQLFENLLFGLGGAEHYRRFFVDLDPAALHVPATLEALTYFRRIARTVVPVRELTWDQAAQGLKNGKFSMQIMGDWVLGEWLDDTGKLPPDILCLPAPAQQPGFIFNIDSLALLRGSQHPPISPTKLTSILSDAEFLQRFNRKKGAIPVQLDIPLSNFNSCSLQAHHDFILALEQQRAVPSFSDSMAICPVTRNAIFNELHRFFLNPNLSENEIINRLQRISHGNKIWCIPNKKIIERTP
jgi:glucose/mannose transport system substrate-binding protein